ncbi:MAG: HD domain-containing protein [Butyrivibrio sp.]|nr:HD domain-containing protein [Butyrivibrio sp.]
MKLMVVGALKPGMVVAQNVYTLDDQLVVSKGTVLDEKTINRINGYSIFNVFIDENIQVKKLSSEIDENRELSFSEKLKLSEDFSRFKTDLEKNSSRLKKTFSAIVNEDKQIDINEITDPVYNLMVEAGAGYGVFDMLNNLHDYSDEIYMHCINVSLICNLIGTWLRLTSEEVKLVTAAGLLHDIGKVKLPENLLNSSTPHSEKDKLLMRSHVTLGYDLVKDMDIDEHIKNCIVMHHERRDGSGYPFHLKGEQIDEFARIVAIADLYDELTSKRLNRGPICAFDVIAMFEKEGLQKFDTKVVMTFLSHISNSFIANRVRLNNGREGDIIFINPDKLSRPMVKCGDDFLDLATHPDLKISEVI